MNYMLPLLALAASLQLTLGYYDPAAQRWINRDPIGERGGMNLYRVAMNDPLGVMDNFGLAAAGKRPPKQGGRYITILPEPPAPSSGCRNAETQRYIDFALSKACEAINSQCFAECMKDSILLTRMRQVCQNSAAIDFECPDKGDDSFCDGKTGDVGRPLCAYSNKGKGGGVGSITVCSSQLDSPNGCGTGSPECMMVHEISHLAGAPGRGPGAAAATEAEKCIPGCSGGGKHPGQP